MMKDVDGMIILTPEEYAEIMKDLDLLYALKAAGVDNWEGWNDAIEMLENEDEDE